MTIYRYSGRIGTTEKGVLFPAILGGLMGLWVLGAMAMTCGKNLTMVELPNQSVASYVSYQPASMQTPILEQEI